MKLIPNPCNLSDDDAANGIGVKTLGANVSVCLRDGEIMTRLLKYPMAMHDAHVVRMTGNLSVNEQIAIFTLYIKLRICQGHQ